MTTTRTVAVAAYLAAVAAPAAADWRAIADMLHSALPAMRGAVKPADASAGSVPKWFADWKLGKVYSLDSLAVTFADGVAVRVNLAKAPGKLPRIAAACRVAIAFYRAKMDRDSVPAFALLVAASDGSEFDAVACSQLTADLRRTSYVPAPQRPAVTAEAIAKMESELQRRRAGLAASLDMPARIAAFHIPLCLSHDAMARLEAELRGMKEAAALAESWRAAIEAGEAELATMRAAMGPAEAPALSPLAIAAIAALADCEPVAAPCEAEAEPCGIAEAPEPAGAGPDGGAEPGPDGADAAADPAEAVEPLPVEPVAADCADSTCTPVVGIQPCTPVVEIGTTCEHIEPLAICPAVGMPCTASCGFRSTCTLPHPVVEIAAAHPVVEIGRTAPCATGSENGPDLSTDSLEAIEAEPLAALCSDDDVPATVGPVTVLCLSFPARVAVIERCGLRAIPTESRGAKHGAFRLSVADARACSDLKSVRFVGLPRKPYTRAVAPSPTPVRGMALPTQSAPFLAALPTTLRHGYAACYSASVL